MFLRPSRVRSSFAALRHGERGQSNIEYALIIGGIGILLMVAVFLLGGKIGDQAASSSAPGGGILKPPSTQCDQNYKGACVPPAPPDLDCGDLRRLGLQLPVTVVGSDPHKLDPDGDGLGC
jgi:hypothetical protein